MGASPSKVGSSHVLCAIDAARNDPWALAEAVKEITPMCPEMSINPIGHFVVQKLLTWGESTTHQHQHPLSETNPFQQKYVWEGCLDFPDW